MKLKTIVIIETLIIFFNIHFAFPTVSYDFWIEYKKLCTYYSDHKITPRVFSSICAASADYGVSIYEIAAIIHSESEFDTYAVSCKSARGLMQVMPFNYHGDVADLFIPEININVGTKYYAYCLKLSGGNRADAIRFYNAGPNSNEDKYTNWKYVEHIIKDTKESDKVSVVKFLEIK